MGCIPSLVLPTGIVLYRLRSPPVFLFEVLDQLPVNRAHGEHGLRSQTSFVV
jgi:hypothetical protein